MSPEKEPFFRKEDLYLPTIISQGKLVFGGVNVAVKQPLPQVLRKEFSRSIL